MAFDTTNLAAYSRKLGDWIHVGFYDVEAIKTMSTDDYDLGHAFVGFVELRAPTKESGNCYGAWNIERSARNPKFSGVGLTMYAVAASLLGKPITSDRDTGTSEKAKALWKRIDADKRFVKLALDNFVNTRSRETVYVDVESDGRITRRAGPKTVSPKDDCRIPGGSLATAEKQIGSPDAYVCSMNTSSFALNHKRGIEIAQRLFRISPDELETMLETEAEPLFNSVYNSAANIIHETKLYPILFEAINVNDFAFARTPLSFVLYDAAKLKVMGKFDKKYVQRSLVAMMEVRQDERGQCSGAYNIVTAARNPAYPGAGMLLYKLASSILQSPLTSDREGSSSEDAKNLWKRIAVDKDFRRIPLDNFYQELQKGRKPKRTYADVTPDNKVIPRDGPRTPPVEDDCKLPGTSASDAEKKLGTGDAFEASIPTKAFTQRHAEVVASVKKKFGVGPQEFMDILMNGSGDLFNSVYAK